MPLVLRPSNRRVVTEDRDVPQPPRPPQTGQSGKVRLTLNKNGSTPSIVSLPPQPQRPRQDTDAGIRNAFLAAAGSSIRTADRAMYAQASWRDEEELPSYQRNDPNKFQGVVRSRQNSGVLSYEEILLQASVMIVVVNDPNNPQPYGIGIGTLTSDGIITHDHYSDATSTLFNSSIWIELRGVNGTIMVRGDQLNGLATIQNGATRIQLSPEDMMQLGAPASFGASNTPLYTGQIPQSPNAPPLAFVYNPAGYQNNPTPNNPQYGGECLDHSCLRVGYVVPPGTNPFEGEANLQDYYSLVLGTTPIRDGIAIGRSDLDGMGQDQILIVDADAENLMEAAYFLPPNDNPLSPGDSGAGYFYGETLIGVYQGSRPYPILHDWSGDGNPNVRYVNVIR